jgi:hypothetical protein
MQQILNVITPAPTYDLVTLAEMKMKLNIPSTDTSRDALLQELISNTSETIATMCNRVFAKETVDETFYQLEDEYCGAPPTQRLYLSRWPVAFADIETMTQDGVDLLATTTWILEQATGTLYQPPTFGPWMGTIDVVYAGGYAIPDGVPNTLKFAVEAVLREQYASWIRNPALYGVRQLGHKESRVSYYAPNLMPTLGLAATWTQIEALLAKYIRHWV